MSNWKTKVFGDTPANFYGWIVAGMLVIFLSLWLAILSAGAGDFDSKSLLLLAIYLVLAGQFGIQLQNYCCRAAMKIESKDEMKNNRAT